MKTIPFLATASMLLFGISAVSATEPLYKPNPWADSYRDLVPLRNYKSWGTYNVHDPSCHKYGDYYYMYSTDAMVGMRRDRMTDEDLAVKVGNIPVRRSKDLVNWEFVGWVLDSIPGEAVKWVHDNNEGRGATNIWAPYIIKEKDEYRLYYCVSAFGRKVSYIGLLVSSSPEGPWTERGCVVKTNNDTPMNAIDPSVIVGKDGKMWMHYGSFFGGIYCVELDRSTGLTKKADDLGHLVARRANYRRDNLEAPEIIYNPELDTYFLFGSYDPLETTYNVRVGRSKKAEGPFLDFNGKELSDTTDNMPVLTAPYRFEEHPGWAGTGHCAAFSDGEGRYFMAHQGRLSPDNGMMVLHVRQMFFTPDGWPVVSPERYAGTPQRTVSSDELTGEWEVIKVKDPVDIRRPEPEREGGRPSRNGWHRSSRISVKAAEKDDKWRFDEKSQLLSLEIGDEKYENLIIFVGHDWERETDTVLFTGLDREGNSFWGKKIK